MLEMSQNTIVLATALALTLGSTYYVTGTNFLPAVQTRMKDSTVFGIIILVQALFGGQGLTEIPEVVKVFMKNPLVKFLLLFLIAFGGTQDIEQAILIVTSFLIFMQMLRTKREREKHPYLI